MRAELPLFALLCCLVVGLFTLAEPPQAEPPSEPGQVKLAVLVVFDQMRGDFLEKWQPYLRPDGFGRLQTQGAWFTDCQYPYANTSTGPGHASMLTGCSGQTHGIVNNNWYDRVSGSEVYCAGSERYELVPSVMAKQSLNPDGTPKKPKPVGTPERNLSEGLADVLKDARPQGKVFGLSLKDRSAIFPTGKRPDGAYWFTGRFVTSTYYRDTVHPWVQEFNESGSVDQYFTKTWNRFRTDLDYTAIVGPDDGPGEGKGIDQGVLFPHPMHGGSPDKLTSRYYEALANSPFGNDILLALAKKCIISEELGQRDETDLLTISFASNDLVGHTWGPDSHEVFDITMRSDALMADLLNFLDQQVGAGKYSLVVTADHGVCPNPEVSAAKGIDAARVSPKKLLADAEAYLSTVYGDSGQNDGKPARWIESAVAPNIYLNRKLLSAKNLKIEDVSAKLAGWLPTQRGILRAFSAQDFSQDRPQDQLFQLSKASFHPDRSGEVVVVTKPYYLLDTYTTGTSHGTPHSYDTHSVFLAYGPGIPGGKRTERITPQHAAPILASTLRLRLPKDCQYQLPTTLLRP